MIHRRKRGSSIVSGLTSSETKLQNDRMDRFRLSFSSAPLNAPAVDMLPDEGGQSSRIMSLGSLFDSVHGDGDESCNSQSDVDLDSESVSEKTEISTPRTPRAPACSEVATIQKRFDTGFICPQCRETLPSMLALLEHHPKCGKPTTPGADQVSPTACLPKLTGYICPQCLSEFPSAEALVEHNGHCDHVRRKSRKKHDISNIKVEIPKNKRSTKDVNSNIAAVVTASAASSAHTPPRASLFRRRLCLADASQAAPVVETPAEASARKIIKKFRERYIMPFVRTFGGPIDETYLRVGEFIEKCTDSMLRTYKQSNKSPFRKGRRRSEGSVDFEESVRDALCEQVESEVMGELYECIWVSLYSKSLERDASIAIRIKLLQDADVDLSEMAGVPEKFLTPLVKGHSGEVPYQAAINAVAKLTSYGNLFPTEQRNLFVAIIKMIYNEAQARAAASATGSSVLAADHFLPLLIYVILCCREIGHPFAVLSAIRCLSSHTSGETEYYLTSFEFALKFIGSAALPAEVRLPHVNTLLGQTRHEHKYATTRCNALKAEQSVPLADTQQKRPHKSDKTSAFNKNSKYYVEPAPAMLHARDAQLLEDENLEEAGWVQTVKFCEIQTAFLFSQITQLEAAHTNLTEMPWCLAAGKEASPLAGRNDVPPSESIRMVFSRKSCVMAVPIVSVVAIHPATGVSVQVEGETSCQERGEGLVFQPNKPLPPRHMVKVLARWSWTPAGGLAESVFTFRTRDNTEDV